jgi:peptidoglycan/LPS O-acetylase OafA/YrhL
MAKAYKIPSLDGLRAISILMVLLAHASASADFPSGTSKILENIVSGSVGVRIFFVISGFLITTLLLQQEQRDGQISLKQFYQRRILRIFPVYFLYIFAVWVFRECMGPEVSNSSYLAACTFTTGLFTEGHWVLWHTWSLSIEEQFYILWPTLLYISTPRYRFALAAVFLLTMPLLRIILYKKHHFELLSYSFLGQGDTIMYGCSFALIAWYKKDLFHKILKYRPTLIRLVALGTIYLFAQLTRHGKCGFITIPFDQGIQSIAIGYIVCSYAHLPLGWGYTWLNFPLMRWIGILSYSLYIWQQLFLYPAGLSGHDHEMPWWRHFPQNFLLVFIAATISYYAIERRFLKLKERAYFASVKVSPEIRKS